MANLDLKPNRYLLIDLEGAIEEVEASKENDLIIRTHPRTGKYSILRNGTEVMKLIHILIDEHGFKLISHSEKPETDQINWFSTFKTVCEERSIKPLPSMTAIPANDSSLFDGVKPEKLIIIKNRAHGIWIAGYDLGDKSDILKCRIREALSELLDIKESERKLHVILDPNESVVCEAREKGWLANTICVPSLQGVIKRIKKSIENQFHKERAEVKAESAIEGLSTLPSVSKKKFKLLDKVVEHGSAASRGWYLDEASNTTWFGKCSYKGLGGWGHEDSVEYVREPDSFDEYREYLASNLYRVLGTKTPELLLSSQILNVDRDMMMFVFGGLNDLEGPKIHLMSQFIDGFTELGDDFRMNYKSRDRSMNRCYQIKGSKGFVPLRGFGRALAVSVFIHDFDCIGNSGNNMGYVEHPDGFAEIVKIDPGEALSFAEDMSGAQTLNNDPEKREALVGTSGKIFQYDDLTYEDKREFAETVRKILEIPNSSIEDLFKPFLQMDDRFDTILSTLLKRKKGILEAFSGEVRLLILNQLKDENEEKAKNLIVNWEKPSQLPFPPSKEGKSTTELIKNRAYLEATVLSSQTSSSTKMFQVPTFTDSFVGRKEELDVLKVHLCLSNKKMNLAAVVGLSGLGKTQLVTEYIRLNQDSYSDIVWLNAEQSSMTYHQIMTYLQVYGSVKFPPQNSDENCVMMFYQSFCGDRVEKKKQRICIVLDNAQKMNDILKYILSPSEMINYNVDLMITSSYQKWEAPIDKIINMQKFSTEEVREYLKSKLPHGKVSNEHIDQFAELHDGLPLAIAQAVAYLQHNNLTVSEYIPHLEEFQKSHNFHFSLLGLIEEKRIHILHQEGNHDTSEHDLNEDLIAVQLKKLSKHGFSSLVFSLANLREMSKIADSILGVLAYLSEDYITKSLLQSCWLHYMKQVQGALFNSSKLTYQQFEEGLELLVAHSFVKGEMFNNENTENKRNKIETNFASSQARKSTDTIIRINSLTQSLIRLIHQENGLFDVYYKSVFDNILQQLKYDERKLDEIQRVSWIIPHGTVLCNMKSQIGDRKYMEMLNEIGCYQLYGSGEYKEALNNLSNVLKISITSYGKNHLETGITLTNLGIAWGDLGNYEKQKELLTRALEIKEKNYGKDHPQTGITLTNLGIAWGDLGNYEKQKDLLTRALKIDEKNYGKDHPKTGITLNGLGNAWGSLGNYQKKKDLLTRALEIDEKHYGKDHPQTGITLTNLGVAWGSLGNYEKQKDLLIRALEIKEKYYGNDHPQMGITLNGLGNAWGSLGNHEKQKDLLTRALEIKEKYYGKDHPETAITLNGLGNAWGSLGNYEKQKDLLTRALKILEKHYGKDHSQTGTVLTNLGVAWGSLGNYKKQKDLLTRALEIREKHYGRDHPETAITLNGLGNAWGSLGNYEKKKDLLIRALEIKETYYGKEHPQTGIILTNLGVAWGDLGNYEKKKDLLTRALEISEKYYGKDHPQTGVTLTSLGVAWGSLGNYKKQKDLLTRALEILEKYYGKDHPQTGITLTNLGVAWGDLGNSEQQKDMLTKALEILEKHYGKEHPQTGIILTNLGVAWGDLGNYEKQKDLLTQALEISEKYYGKDHPQTGITLNGLGDAWGDLGNYEKQKGLLTRAHLIFLRSYGEHHPYTKFALKNLQQIGTFSF